MMALARGLTVKGFTAGIAVWRRGLLCAVATVMAGALFAAPASAAQKLALIIGNDDYEAVSKLERAVADARAYRNLLENERGFTIYYAENAGRRKMNSTVAQFLAAIQPGDTAMVIYSGHGVQLDPERRDSLYLLPVDFPNEDPGRGAERHFFDAESVNFARLAENVTDRGAQLRVFILDACRDNPFEREGTRSIGMSRGLGRIQSTTGEFVIYAAAPGEVAYDSLPTDESESVNSVFTRAFIKHFKRGRFLEDVANDVQAEVAALTRKANVSQLPYSSDGVPGWTCMDDKCGEDVVDAVDETDKDQGDTDGGNKRTAQEELYWSYCADNDDPEFCRAYLDQFPDSWRARLAQARLASLSRSSGGDGGGEPPLTGQDDRADKGKDGDKDTGTKTVDKSGDDAVDETVDQTKAGRDEKTADGTGQDNTKDDGKDEIVASIDPNEDKARGRSLRPVDRNELRDTQARLTMLGFKPGPIDGQMGKRTRSAIKGFQADKGLPADGKLTNEVFELLVKAVPGNELKSYYDQRAAEARAARERRDKRNAERRERERSERAARRQRENRERANQRNRDNQAARDRERRLQQERNSQAERDRQARLAREREREAAAARERAAAAARARKE